jgi:hypothetical protein
LIIRIINSYVSGALFTDLYDFPKILPWRTIRIQIEFYQSAKTTYTPWG